MSNGLPPHPPHNRPQRLPDSAVWDFWRAMDNALAAYRRARALASDEHAAMSLAMMAPERLDKLHEDLEAEALHLMTLADQARQLAAKAHSKRKAMETSA